MSDLSKILVNNTLYDIKDVKAREMTKSIGGFLSLTKKKNYLYEAYYNDIDYTYANDYYKSHATEANVGGCSSIRKGDWFGKNHDWTYSNQVEFIVHTPSIANRFASVGVSSGLSTLTNEFVSSGEYSDLYKIIPFQLADGSNEKGVTASMLVVPLDKGSNRSVPTGEKTASISGLMLVRYMLDYFGTASEAVNYIKEHVEVYFPDALHSMNYETHYLVADRNDTYILEFVDNEAVIIDVTDKPYVTNFYIDGVTFNEDGTVYTPETQDSEHNAIDTNLITENGSGLERYNAIVQAYDLISGKTGMRNLLNSLKYTKAYSTASTVSSPFWYTEYVGYNGLNVVSTTAEYASTVAYYGSAFSTRVRDGEPAIWQTTHSSIYDIKNQKLYLVVQEDGIEEEFVLSTGVKQDYKPNGADPLIDPETNKVNSVYQNEITEYYLWGYEELSPAEIEHNVSVFSDVEYKSRNEYILTLKTEFGDIELNRNDGGIFYFEYFDEDSGNHYVFSAFDTGSVTRTVTPTPIPIDPTALYLQSPPTSYTVANFKGQKCYVGSSITNISSVYECVAIDNGIYTWKRDAFYSDISVTSVNSKTGNVVLSASDVGALSDQTTIPTKVSELQNDSDFADKAFVNSTVGTNTAIFRGSFNVVDDLGLTYQATHEEVSAALATEITTKTNNDYCYVYFIDPLTEEPTRYDRYKYSDNEDSWQYEFSLNNSSFTAVQWSAINSGITASIVDSISSKEDNSNKTTLLSSSSTDIQYPSAKAVYDFGEDIRGDIPSLSGYATESYVDISVSSKENISTIVTISDSSSTQITHNTEYRGGTLSAFTLTLPTTIPDHFDAWVSFTSGVTATDITYPADSIVWSGDDITDGEFVPAASKRYNVGLWYDGSILNGIVRGVTTA